MTRACFRVAAACALLMLGAAAREAAACSCTISVSGISFGGYDPIAAAPLPGTGILRYVCSGGVETVSIWLGTGGSGSYASRRMIRGSEVLRYNLYLDAAHTVVWGDGSSGTGTYVRNAPPDDRHIPVTMFGLVPAGQDVTAGSFRDEHVTVTINF